MKRLLLELRALVSADAISPTPPSQAHSTEGIPLIIVELSESRMRLLATLLTFFSLIASSSPALPTIQEESGVIAEVPSSTEAPQWLSHPPIEWNRIPHEYYPCGSYYESYKPDPMLDHVQVDWSTMMGRWGQISDKSYRLIN